MPPMVTNKRSPQVRDSWESIGVIGDPAPASRGASPPRSNNDVVVVTTPEMRGVAEQIDGAAREEAVRNSEPV